MIFDFTILFSYLLKMHQRTIFFSLLLSCFIASQPLNAQFNTVFNEEKLSLGLGAGVQYAFVGFQGRYFFSKYLGASASVNYSPYGAMWNAGIEVRIPEARPQRVAPYFNFLVGTNSFIAVNAFIFTTPTGPFESIDEQRKFIGGVIGAGIKWDAFDTNRSYFKIGFDFLIVNKGHSQFVDEFNSIYATTYSRDWRKFVPSLGYAFSLAQKKNE